MTFNWKMAVMYLRDGRRVRSSQWDNGKYLSFYRGNIVDQDFGTINQDDLDSFGGILSWKEYLEFSHGSHRGTGNGRDKRTNDGTLELTENAS